MVADASSFAAVGHREGPAAGVDVHPPAHRARSQLFTHLDERKTSMSLHFSRLAKLTLTALSAATLVACGGGNDDKPHVPLSSECAPPTTLATATSNY